MFGVLTLFLVKGLWVLWGTFPAPKIGQSEILLSVQISNWSHYDKVPALGQEHTAKTEEGHGS